MKIVKTASIQQKSSLKVMLLMESFTQTRSNRFIFRASKTKKSAYVLLVLTNIALERNVLHLQEISYLQQTVFQEDVALFHQSISMLMVSIVKLVQQCITKY